MGHPAIKAFNVSKKYDLGGRRAASLRENFSNLWRKRADPSEFWALRDVSFEIEKGEAIGIVGKNGAGKSTLLKVLCRITTPTSGRVEIYGSVSSLLEVGTGFHPELSGRENVYLNGTILGMKRAEVKVKFDEIVAFSGVEMFIDTPIKHYSSGMKVRLAFSVAAHLEPEILIIDEVLAVGDFEFQKKCLGKMEEVTGDGRTIIFVSHNMEAVKKLCQKSILLKDGNLQMSGSTDHVVEEYLRFENGNTTLLSHQLSQRAVNDHILIWSFELSKSCFCQFEDVHFSLTVKYADTERISQLALLIFNNLQQRVAIVDLRDALTNSVVPKTELSISGDIMAINLLPGNYYMGLYINSLFFSGNVMNLLEFSVDERQSEHLLYPKEVRGFVDFQVKFNK